MTDEQFRLIYSLIGLDGVADAKVKVKDLSTQSADLFAQLGRGEITNKEFGESFKIISRDVKEAEGILSGYDRMVKSDATKQAAQDKRDLAQATREAAEQERSYRREAVNDRKFDQQQTREFAAESAAAAAAAAASSRTISTSTAGAAGSTRNLGAAAQAASYAFQDFTSQGANLAQGLMSVQNNIPQILTGLGMGVGLAGAVSVVTVGVGLLISNWGTLGDLLTEQHGVPETLQGLDAIEAHLKATSKELDELRKQTTLSYDELQRFYSLEYDERKAKEDRDTARDAQKVKDAPTTSEKEYAAAAATAADHLGGGKDLEKAIAEYVEAELGVVIEGAWTEVIHDVTGRKLKTVEHPAIVGFRDILTGGYTNELQETVDQFMQALSKGNESIFKFLGNRALKGNKAGDVLRANDPANIKEIDRANKEEAQAIEEGTRQAAEETQRKEKAAREADQAEKKSAKEVQDDRERQGKEALDDPAFKREEKARKDKGEIDDAGRTRDMDGFDEAGAFSNRAKAQAAAKAREERDNVAWGLYPNGLPRRQADPKRRAPHPGTQRTTARQRAARKATAAPTLRKDPGKPVNATPVDEDAPVAAPRPPARRAPETPQTRKQAAMIADQTDRDTRRGELGDERASGARQWDDDRKAKAGTKQGREGPQPRPQPAGDDSAGLDRVLDQVAGVQSNQQGMQQTTAGILARLQAIEQNNRRVAGTNGQLTQRANEMGPTALNFNGMA